MQFNASLKSYARWRYHNTFLFVLSLILLYVSIDSPVVDAMIQSIGSLRYLGAFITGIFFVSLFTVAPAMVVLYHFASFLNPYEVAIFAGIGAVVGDYIIFRFLKDRIFEEVAPVFRQLGGSYIIRLFHTPYFTWLTPLLGAAIIASPIPDEVGIGILGLSKIKNWQFVLLSFLLNSVGILLIISFAQMK